MSLPLNTPAGSRRRPKMPRNGSRKWWRIILRAWGEDIARGVPRKSRPRALTKRQVIRRHGAEAYQRSRKVPFRVIR